VWMDVKGGMENEILAGMAEGLLKRVEGEKERAAEGQLILFSIVIQR
jgi:hypothetical protein